MSWPKLVGTYIGLLLVMKDLGKELGPQFDDHTVMKRFSELLRSFERTAYDNAQKDFYLYNRAQEARWIDDLYRTVSYISSQTHSILEWAPSSQPIMTSLGMIGLIEELAESAIKDINSRATTRRLMGKVGPTAISKLIHPKPLVMQMRESWHGLLDEVAELKTKSEQSVNGADRGR